MSIYTIKQELETKLNTDITTKAIKWNNSSVYTLNSVTLNQTQIDALTEFIEPKIIPITEDRELISDANGFKYEVFFQINVYNKSGTGTGAMYQTIALLNGTFKETITNGVICDMTETLSSFQEGEWIITAVRFRCHLWSS